MKVSEAGRRGDADLARRTVDGDDRPRTEGVRRRDEQRRVEEAEERRPDRFPPWYRMAVDCAPDQDARLTQLDVVAAGRV